MLKVEQPSRRLLFCAQVGLSPVWSGMGLVALPGLRRKYYEDPTKRKLFFLSEDQSGGSLLNEKPCEVGNVLALSIRSGLEG